ncbi:MAG: hypothetical protein MJ223_03800 [Mycoplasmoidaceae bacterium]|nr:hypothetical protein [Mycoplasmoidaceae bacterium]
MIRLIGITISKLVKTHGDNSIASQIIPRKQNKLTRLVKDVNKKLGKDLVFIAKDKFTS